MGSLRLYGKVLRMRCGSVMINYLCHHHLTSFEGGVISRLPSLDSAFHEIFLTTKVKLSICDYTRYGCKAELQMPHHSLASLSR